MPLPSLVLQKSGPWRASLNGHQLSLPDADGPTDSDGLQPFRFAQWMPQTGHFRTLDQRAEIWLEPDVGA
jgi:hypothetical protein